MLFWARFLGIAVSPLLPQVREIELRVDFSNHRDVNIGAVVYSQKSNQMGIVLSKIFNFRTGFMVEIMFESSVSIRFKGNDDIFSEIKSTGREVDLSRFAGSSDPYGSLIRELRHIRLKDPPESMIDAS